MQGRRRARFLLLLFSPGLIFIFPIQSKQIFFKGFTHQTPEYYLGEIQSFSVDEARRILDESGFFRNVIVEESQEAWTIKVEEYPLITGIRVSGDTLYPLEWWEDFFSLHSGGIYNRRVLQQMVNAFHDRMEKEGFVHLKIEKIDMDENGRVNILVDDGILSGVAAEGNSISPRVLRSIFHDCIGVPYNVHRVKLALEQLLYTQAFHFVDSRVKKEEGKIILLIETEKKKVHYIRSETGAGTLTGFGFSAGMGIAAAGSALGFIDTGVYLQTRSRTTFFLGQIRHASYRSRIGKSDFPTTLSFHYLKSPDYLAPYFSLRLRQEFSFRLFSGSRAGPMLCGGWYRPYYPDGKEKIGLEAGFFLTYHAESALSNREFQADAEVAGSLDSGYLRTLVSARYRRDWRSWTGEAAIFWNHFQGDSHPFEIFKNRSLSGWILPPQIWRQTDLGMAMAKVQSPYLGHLFRIGPFCQYIRGEKAYFLSGIHATFSFWSFPLHARVFFHQGKIEGILSSGLNL